MTALEFQDLQEAFVYVLLHPILYSLAVMVGAVFISAVTTLLARVANRLMDRD